jgi:hypothetical protein
MTVSILESQREHFSVTGRVWIGPAVDAREQSLA